LVASRKGAPADQRSTTFLEQSMRYTSFLIPGEVTLKVTITELSGNKLEFKLENQAGGTIADLRGLFFDFANSEILSSNLSIAGGEVTGYSILDDGVTNLGGGVNMNGVGVFDAGILFGTAGIGKDDISSTTFTITSDQSLRLEDFLDVDFGVRYTSVGDADGAREGSLKIFGDSDDAVILDTMPPPVDPWPFPPAY
jgi:hypothetical protein